MERTIECKKSLLVDENFFDEVNEIYDIIGLTPKYIIETKENATYTFNDISSLLNYKFDEQIEELTIQPNEYSRFNSLHLYLRIIEGVILNYDTVAKCRYEIENDSIDSILKEKINKLYQNHKKADWLLGKIGIFTILTFLSFIYIIIYAFMIITDNLQIVTFSFSYFVPFWICAMVIIYIIRLFDLIISKQLFTPIVYYIGYQKQKWDNRVTLRSNIFWCIIIGLIIGIITSFITSNF